MSEPRSISKPYNRKKSAIAPRVTVRGLLSVLNRPATELIMQERARYLAVIRDGDKILLRPFDIDGLVTITAISPTTEGRALASLHLIGDRTSSFVCDAIWNDCESALEINLSNSRPARKNGTAKKPGVSKELMKAFPILLGKESYPR